MPYWVIVLPVYEVVAYPVAVLVELEQGESPELTPEDILYESPEPGRTQLRVHLLVRRSVPSELNRDTAHPDQSLVDYACKMQVEQC